MAARREDYLLQMIGHLRILVAEAVRLRDTGKLNQALQAIVIAQEKLFARPAQVFMTLGLDEQIQLLRQGETPTTAYEKCLGYAELLQEAGVIYQRCDNIILAHSAIQSALYVTLQVVAEKEVAPTESEKDRIRALLDQIPFEQLHAPVKDLLLEINLRSEKH